MKITKSVFATAAIAAFAFVLGISSCKKDHNGHDMDMLNINYPAAYIVNGSSNNISVIRLSDNTVTETIGLNGATYPHHIYLNPAKKEISRSYYKHQFKRWTWRTWRNAYRFESANH